MRYESQLINFGAETVPDFQILRSAAYLMECYGGVDSPRWAKILADKLELAYTRSFGAKALCAELPADHVGWMESGA